MWCVRLLAALFGAAACAPPCGAEDLRLVLERAQTGEGSAERRLAVALDDRCPSVPLRVRDRFLSWADAMDGETVGDARAWDLDCPGVPFRAPWDATPDAAEAAFTACGGPALAPFGSGEALVSAGGPEAAVVASALYQSFAAGGSVAEARDLVDAIAFRASGAEASTWGRHAGRLGGQGLIVSPAAPDLIGGVCQPLIHVGPDGVRVEGGDVRSTADPRWLAASFADVDGLYREAAEHCGFAKGNGVLVGVAPDATVADLDAVLGALASSGETTATLLVARAGGPIGTRVVPDEFGRVAGWVLDLRPEPRQGAWVELQPTGFDVGRGHHRLFPASRCGATSTVTLCPKDGTWDWEGLDATGVDPVDVAVHRAVRLDAWVAILDRLGATGRLRDRVAWRPIGQADAPPRLDGPVRRPELWVDGLYVGADVDGPPEALPAVDGLLQGIAACLAGASGCPIRIVAEAGPDAPVLAIEPSSEADRAAAGCLWDVTSALRLGAPAHVTVALSLRRERAPDGIRDR